MSSTRTSASRCRNDWLLAAALAAVAGCGSRSSHTPDAGVSADASGESVVVMTEQGALRGTHKEALRVFRGIPYAAPPIGQLRFAPPRAPSAHEGEADATEFGPECPQFGRDAVNPLLPSDAIVGNEDCLTLNVWSHDDAGIRPVMVWIHGGGFTRGSGSADLYEGSKLARNGDVVVVTINYRLGALGLMATQALIDESVDGTAGNQAIRDQIAALQWVQANIRAFGGDASNVTIFGESAGGQSVCVLAGAPAAEGLFAKAIVQSGGGCNGLSRIDAFTPFRISALERGDEITAAVGCADAPAALTCLRAAPFEDLVRASAEVTPSLLGLPDFAPSIDDVFVTDNTSSIFSRGERDLPLIIGSTANEADIFTFAVPITSEQQYEDLLVAAMGATMAEQVLSIYPIANYPTPKAAYNAFGSEVAFICPGLVMAEVAAADDHPAYSYLFTHRMSGALARFGAFHAVELQYLFGNPITATYSFTAEDEQVSALMQAAWSSFAYASVPEVAPEWPAFDSAGATIFQINDSPSVAADVSEGRCAQLEALGLVQAAGG